MSLVRPLCLAGTANLSPAPARSHCNTLDKPGIVAADHAIERGSVDALEKEPAGTWASGGHAY